MNERETAEKLAKDHVAWFLETIKPLLETHMVHGYKHGFVKGFEDGCGADDEVLDDLDDAEIWSEVKG